MQEGVKVTGETSAARPFRPLARALNQIEESDFDSVIFRVGDREISDASELRSLMAEKQIRGEKTMSIAVLPKPVESEVQGWWTFGGFKDRIGKVENSYKKRGVYSAKQKTHNLKLTLPHLCLKFETDNLQILQVKG